MNHDPFDPDVRQLALSLQLLELIKWLSEHEQEGLKRLIAHAVQNGLQERLAQPLTDESEVELQEGIVEIFSLMEALLYEVMHEDKTKKLSKSIPAIDHIDGTVDEHLVSLSAATTAHTLECDPSIDPKEELCKELLRRWKPSKKLGMN